MMDYRDREKQKKMAWDILYSNSNKEERKKAITLIAETNYYRYLETTTASGLPTFSEYMGH